MIPDTASGWRCDRVPATFSTRVTPERHHETFRASRARGERERLLRRSGMPQSRSRRPADPGIKRLLIVDRGLQSPMANRRARARKPSTASDPTRPRLRRGAKALISTPSRVLLVKERHADGSPFWTLPGGGVYRHESLIAGLRRELVEELRCRSTIGEELTTFWYAHSSRPSATTVYTVFDCVLLSEAAPNRNEGVLDRRWVNPAAPPPSTLPQVRYLLSDDRFDDRRLSFTAGPTRPHRRL